MKRNIIILPDIPPSCILVWFSFEIFFRLLSDLKCIPFIFSHDEHNYLLMSACISLEIFTNASY